MKHFAFLYTLNASPFDSNESQPTFYNHIDTGNYTSCCKPVLQGSSKRRRKPNLFTPRSEHLKDMIVSYQI